MASPNNREVYKTEVSEEYATDINGNTHTNLTRNTEKVSNSQTNPTSFQEGYIHGRNKELNFQQANLAERDNNNAARGLLLGLILTSLVGLVVGAVWYFNQRTNEAIENAAPVVVPVPNRASSSPAAAQSPQPKTTIIERTREIPVLVPQQQVAPAAAPSPPAINVTVPPAAAPSPPAINVTVPSPRPAAAQKAPSATQTIPKEIPSPKTPVSNTSGNTPVPENRNNTSNTTSPTEAERSGSTPDSNSSTTTVPSSSSSTPPSSSGSTP
ncbi:hypothetical protein NIES4074_18450 [Cylindrospermum sp. NIES-4074]|nr:hypothetical protein NIES4074_18450 [Cylindrospermum sp. NIES-4074]